MAPALPIPELELTEHVQDHFTGDYTTSASGPTQVGARHLPLDRPQVPDGQRSPVPFPATVELGDWVPLGRTLQGLLRAFLPRPVSQANPLV